MKHLLIFLICINSCFHCEAQSPHVPNPKAKLINDKAINTYTGYSTNHDSIVSVIRQLDKALKIDSNYYNAWTNKLGFQCQIGQYENALETAKRMEHIFPNETDIIFFGGILQYKVGYTSDAEATFNKLLKIYDSVHDKNNNSDHLKTTLLNKGLALIIVNRDNEGRKILAKLRDDESDPAVKQYINAYVTKSREEIIDDMIPGK